MNLIYNLHGGGLMNAILKTLTEDYHLTENEQCIIDYIIKHIDDISALSIRQLASLTYTSTSSIMRISRKLGYQHYHDFKYAIASKIKSYTLDNNELISDDNLVTIVNKLSAIEKNAVNDVNSVLTMTLLNNILSLLEQYQYIDIYAMSANARIAEYAAHLLSTVGKFVQVYHDVDLMLNHSLNMKNDHAVFIVSKYSKNTHQIEAAKTLQKRGIPFVSITSKSETAISQYATYSIRLPFNTASIRVNETYFYTAVKYVFDLLYSILFVFQYDDALNNEELYSKLFWSPK